MRQYVKYGSTSSTVYEVIMYPETGLEIPTPNSHRAGIKINSLGFRGPELAVPKPKGITRIAFLGGSTTYCAEVSGNSATWPSLVIAQLAKMFPRNKFDYVNAGAPGYSTGNSDRNFVSMDTRAMARARGLSGTDDAEEDSWLADISVVWFFLRELDASQAPGRCGHGRGKARVRAGGALKALRRAAQKLDPDLFKDCRPRGACDVRPSYSA